MHVSKPLLLGAYSRKLHWTQLEATETHVAYQPKQAPLWPTGFQGSISHKQDHVAVVVVAAPQCAVGLDIEYCFHEAQAHKLQKKILTASEIAAHHPGLSKAEWVTLIFSAKEALFKTLHPMVQQFFGFQAAQMTDINLESGQFTLALTQTLSPSFQKDIHSCKDSLSLKSNAY